MYLVTGASGQLGRLIISSLLEKGIPATDIVAAVRDPDKVSDLAEAGIVVRHANYNDPASLKSAFSDVRRAVLVSSSEVGQRAAQHANVIDAAKNEGVELLAYTSILGAATSKALLAEEHKATEEMLAASGIPCAVLRNGWYLENYTAMVSVAIEHGAVLGSAKEGKFSAASRSDYAEAAASVLISEGQAGKVYELAGDSAFTLSEYAEKVTELSGKTVVYQDLPEQDYAAALQQFGLPEGFAKVLANADVCASDGALFDDSKTLSAITGRPTTALAQAIQAAL